MKRICPNLSCAPVKSILLGDPRRKLIVRKGFYYRSSDQRRVVRYFCKTCRTHFSSSTLQREYRQKRRELNKPLYQLLCSGISQRRAAHLLQANSKTIVRKFRQLALEARGSHQGWLNTHFLEPSSQISCLQFDDLETSEHTKCKPISVTLGVHEKTREILAFQVSRMPAKGLLAKIALKRYGFRQDERQKGFHSFFRQLQPYVAEHAQFKSDQNPHYPSVLKKHFPKASHQTFAGARGSVSGQGELKKLRFDPLFSLNHTCAMLRANLNRLFRRTWCTTKTVQGLIDHLSLYVVFHNQVLIPLASGATKWGS